MKNFITTPPKTRSAFTLIELLVVIAIIAILAAILFPVFARARENARRSSCSSNLKQISLGIIQYTQDYDEKYPGFFYNADSYWSSQVQPYLKSDQIYQCPSEPTTQGDKNSASYVDYFFNKALCSYDPAFNASLGLNQAALPNVSLTLMMGDFISTGRYDTLPKYFSNSENGDNCAGILGSVPVPDGSGPCSDQAALPRKTAAIRHLEGANYAFADGHVKFYRPNSLYGAATPFSASGSSPTFHAKD